VRQCEAMKCVLIVGQAPPLKDAIVPYERTRLWKWLEDAGVQTYQVAWRFDSVLLEFPGRTRGTDRPPSRDEIAVASDRLAKTIPELRPHLVILVGLAAATAVLGQAHPIHSLDDAVGQIWNVAGMPPAVVLPHPSGRSTWIYSSEERMAALQASLGLIRENLSGDISH